MLGYFIWNSFVILALQQPITFHSNGILWMSSKDFARVQSLPGKITLSPIRLGQFFVSGANFEKSSHLSDPANVFITTPANFLALRKCGLRKSLQKNLSIESGELRFSGNTLDPGLRNCGFDRLSFSNGEAPAGIEASFAHAENQLRKNAYSIGLARWQDGRRLLTIYSSIDSRQLEKSLPENLLPFYDFDFHSQISPGKNLIFELTLFEFSRDRAQHLGIKWPKSISLLSIDQRGKPSLRLSDESNRQGANILLTTDFGESQGVGKVLARPTLRTQPGSESRFSSGGEFPIRNNNAFYSETTWKSYGLKLALTPSAGAQAGDREVSLDFKMEFSEPSPDMQVDGIPGLIQRQLDSRFDVRMNELTILTTMVTLRENKAREGLYFLSQIPILSLLFAERANRNNDSELWFALKPMWDEIPLNAARDRKVELQNRL